MNFGPRGARAGPSFQRSVTRTSLIDALRQGGYIIVLRYADTDMTRPDQERTDLADCDTQRILSVKDGRQPVRSGPRWTAIGNVNAPGLR